MQVVLDRTRIRSFCDRWGVSELSVFGSVLRDDFHAATDVDVLVAFDPSADWDYWNWPEMLDDLRSIFGRDVDLVVDEALRNPFWRDSDHEGQENALSKLNRINGSIASRGRHDWPHFIGKGQRLTNTLQRLIQLAQRQAAR